MHLYPHISELFILKHFLHKFCTIVFLFVLPFIYFFNT
nr:MAG TPA: hypothetical protein [Caudoviricetes sp.]